MSQISGKQIGNLLGSSGRLNPKYMQARTDVTGADGTVTVTFPTPFDGVPSVVATVVGNNSTVAIVKPGVPTATGFTFRVISASGATMPGVYVTWLAIDPTYPFA